MESQTVAILDTVAIQVTDSWRTVWLQLTLRVIHGKLALTRFAGIDIIGFVKENPTELWMKNSECNT